ncbi:MAG: M20/M25/M40 family metallo-hydrolase [Clostridiales bacterium]|jgi:acetylornithine deacetylase|nr:M20/M25/M40 family metallo-hydrolase [Clostridiales bacterium]
MGERGVELSDLDGMADRARGEMVEFLKQLIRIPTENKPPVGFEGPGQALFAQACADIGLEVETFRPDEAPGMENHPEFLNGRNFDGRVNVEAVWKGGGRGKGLLLSGHMDVVPKEPLPWTKCEPFEPLEEDGKVYGRGACDMKSGLAAAYTAIKLLKATGWTPPGDIILESVADEEYAGGSGTLAGRLKGYNAGFAVNMEPTWLSVYSGAVGAFVVKITVRGGTAGMPYNGEDAENPVFCLAKLAQALRAFESYRRGPEFAHPFWTDPAKMAKVIITKAKSGEAFEHGQLAVPVDGWLEAVVQTYPGETGDAVCAQLERFLAAEAEKDAELKNASVSIRRLYHYIEPCLTDAGFAGIGIIKECLEGAGVASPVVGGASASCDLAIFEKYGGAPAVMFGPSGGNLHGPDEWVDIDSMVVVVKTLMRLMLRWEQASPNGGEQLPRCE